jgi:DNA-directed RNA polymerase subunit RPC12/RpoP
MSEAQATICTCDQPKWCLVGKGRRRCFNCRGWKREVVSNTATQSGACPNCGSAAAPWTSNNGSKCPDCGHVVDFGVTFVDNTTVRAGRKEAVAAGPSHSVSFSSPTRA